MRIPLGFGLVLSLNLNKGRYASCLNPHILVCRPQQWGYGIRFPAHWSIWNIELDRTKRRKRKAARIADERRAIRLVAGGYRWPFSLFEVAGGTTRLYWRIPFVTGFHTRMVEWKRQ